MEECKHNWIFQETKKKYTISGYQSYYATFIRVDRYYCSNCCEIKEMEKKETVSLPSGGIHNPTKYAPVWY
jgi:hypothetical protein